MSAVAVDREAESAQDRTSCNEAVRDRTTAGLALGVAMGGLAVVAVALAGFVVERRPARPGVAETSAQSSTVLAPLPAVGVAQVVYERGHTSGWHAHDGVHSVVVLSGALTVYDQNCTRHEYLPGQTYLGGSEPHVARNEGETPAELAVTYVYTTKGDPGRTTAAPAGCSVQ